MTHNYGKVYPFSNENLSAFGSIYDYCGANVLTVAGSGDQFFVSLLNGAKQVDLFDVNNLTWYFFVLKFVGICVLNYEDFYNFFVINKTDDVVTYNKLREKLPLDIKSFFDNLLKLKRKFSSIQLHSALYPGPSFMGDGRILPYFERNNYYQLQELLRKRKLPKFYSADLHELINILDIPYDLVMLSNIYMYVSDTLPEFIKLLDKLDAPVIQADYIWHVSKKNIDSTINLGLIPSYIPSVTNVGEDLILTYKK